MNQERMNQKQLFMWITMLGFCSDDIVLYLDTHPMDENALDYYNQCMKLYKEAVDTYEREYGMLSVGDGNQTDSWNWTDRPMPWEGGRK